MFNKKSLLVLGVAALVLSGCVEHRPIRNGLRNESVYLDKTELLTAKEGHDDLWLKKVTVVKASSPNVLGGITFPGFEGDAQLVKMRFAEESLQIIDAHQMQKDDPENPNDDLATTAETVLFEFPGSHVDVKLAETLDGERTNLLEENYEEAWNRRQKFKVDFENMTLTPIHQLYWYYGEVLQSVLQTASVTLVPDSFEWDADERYMSFVVEVNYSYQSGPTSVQYRFSFWQRPMNDGFVPTVIDEKAEVNKKYGSFQHINVFRDAETGLLSGDALLHRWDPNREEPVVFYFHKGFPERFKPMFEEIKAATNKTLEEAGAKLRFDFREYNDGGIERHLGDLRYSFAVWHQDIDTTAGLLGYGPSSADPRTGEILNANLNLYNVGMDRYRYLIEDFLRYNGAAQVVGGEACDPNATPTAGALVDPSTRYSSPLFEAMRRVLDKDQLAGDPMDIFLPSPNLIGAEATEEEARDRFLNDYLRTLPEYRYTEPGWNSYVNKPSWTNDKYQKAVATEERFNDLMHSISMNENPFGTTNLASLDGIEAMNEFMQDMRGFRRNHEELQHMEDMMMSRKNIFVFNANDALSAITNSSRKCIDGVWETDDAFRERIIEAVVFNVAIHEFGHNLSLRHNFYGSVDAKHHEHGDQSSTVMDYVRSQYEASGSRDWGGYDKAALKWIYGSEEVRAEMMKEDFLYCTDDHRGRSALCTAHDLGITPAQIVLNAIEQYDYAYNTMNRRAYRKFWDTSSYGSFVYNSLFPMMRMWYLGIFDWAGGGVQQTLKRLDQVEAEAANDGRSLPSEQEYTERSVDFYNDVQAATDMMMAFYDAIINQPANQRNYQTEFDPYYGDILRLGIITDKLYSAIAFMDLQDVYNYDPNIAGYAAMYDSNFGGANSAVAQRVLDNMLGANYDIFPWFRFLAVNIFASATNSNLIGDISLRDRIALERFENLDEFLAMYGEQSMLEATAEGNSAQVFVHNGEEHIFTFLPDQGWYLVANRSRNPVSYQYVRDHNEDLNAGADDSRDNYGLKVLLAYYEFYNNFSGY